MRNLVILICIIFLFQACNSKQSGKVNIAESKNGQNNANLFLPGIVNTGLFEMNSSFSRSGDEFYFSVADPFQNFNAIVSVKKEENKWVNPEIVNFSGQFSDFDPFLTQYGKRMYFCSRRPLAQNDESVGDANIWYIDKKEGNWGQPKALDSLVNSSYDEYYVSLSKNGKLFFSSTREGGTGMWDIYYSYNNKVLNLGKSINTKYREWDPFIAPDESYIIFTSDRPNGFGGGDLYISFKNTKGEWNTPVNLGKDVNTSDYEYCPYISSDGKYLYFSRFGGSSFPYKSNTKRSYTDLKIRLNSSDNGLGSIYRIKLSDLKMFKSLQLSIK